MDSAGEDKSLASQSSKLGYNGAEVNTGCLLQPRPFKVSVNFVDPLSYWLGTANTLELQTTKGCTFSSSYFSAISGPF